MAKKKVKKTTSEVENGTRQSWRGTAGGRKARATKRKKALEDSELDKLVLDAWKYTYDHRHKRLTKP